MAPCLIDPQGVEPWPSLDKRDMLTVTPWVGEVVVPPERVELSNDAVFRTAAYTVLLRGREAGEQGFEPRFPGPEPGVLPLDDSPMGADARIELAIQKLMRLFSPPGLVPACPPRESNPHA